MPAKEAPASGSPAPRPTAKTFFPAERVIVDPTRIKPPRPKAIVMGEGWGCAQFVTEVGSRYQCWDTIMASKGAQGPNAWVVPWLELDSDGAVMAAPDHVCMYERSGLSYRCWDRPRRGDREGHELPLRMEWLNPTHAGQGPRGAAAPPRDVSMAAFTGGTFGCLRGWLGDLWCVGDDDLGQLGDAGQRFVDRGMPTYFLQVDTDDVALGLWHGCALSRLSATPQCWGRGDFGQLGHIPPTPCPGGKGPIRCGMSPQQGPATAATERERALRAADLFTCMADPKGILCWGANQDAFFGARGSCPPEIRHAWPTLHGTRPAPNAACPKNPERVAGITEFPVRFEVGPRGVCFNVGGALRCRGGIPSPRGGETAFQDTIVASDEMARVVGWHVAHEPDVIAVSPGEDASACAIHHADGSVVCWGEGYSPSEAPDLPVTVTFENATPASEVAVYGPHGSADDWGDDDCVIRRGCTLRPAALAACPRIEGGASGLQDAPSWSEFSGSAEQHEGQVIRVRGALGIGAGSMTLKACFALSGKPACCNRSTGIVMLDGALKLEGLFCAGDDSETCCNAPAYGQTVVATGRLTRSSSNWILSAVTLCEPQVHP